MALGTASFLNEFNILVLIHLTLVQLFFDEDRFDDAHAHIKHAKSHAINNNDPYLLADVMELQA